jgi:hypothetical protein
MATITNPVYVVDKIRDNTPQKQLIAQKNIITKETIRLWNNIDEVIEKYPSFKKPIILKNLYNITKSAYAFVWTYYILPQEIYRTLLNYPDFDISNHGKIMNNKTNEILKMEIDNGYYVVSMHKNDSNNHASKLYDYPEENLYVHYLVAEAFLPNVYYSSIVYHIDNNTLNNIVTNLITERPNLYKMKIKQFNLATGADIAIYDNIDEIIGVNHEHVYDACEGICNGSGGFGWAYCG